MNKICACCKEVKDTSLFGGDKHRKDKLNPYCTLCVRQKSMDYANANREAKRAAVKKYDDANREKIKAWREANADSMKEYWATYGKKYRTEFKAETAAKTRRQQAARRNAVPVWIDREKEVLIYEEARIRREAGEAVEVDHIFPILGKTVCGLHWHGNLRVVPTFANRSKGNRIDKNEHPLAFARVGMRITDIPAG